MTPMLPIRLLTVLRDGRTPAALLAALALAHPWMEGTMPG